MTRTVADFVLERLGGWCLHRIFGYPGDGINGFLGALARADGDPEFIQVRHEEAPAFMACGHAKFTGEVGVCLATSGPGAIHLLNGLYDAKLDRQPVLAIVGQQKRMSLGSDYQQEVDLAALFQDVSEYVQVCAAVRAGPPSRRPSRPHRARPTRRLDAHLPERRAGGGRGRFAAERARRRVLRSGLRAAARAPGR